MLGVGFRRVRRFVSTGRRSTAESDSPKSEFARTITEFSSGMSSPGEKRRNQAPCGSAGRTRRADQHRTLCSCEVELACVITERCERTSPSQQCSPNSYFRATASAPNRRALEVSHLYPGIPARCPQSYRFAALIIRVQVVSVLMGRFEPGRGVRSASDDFDGAGEACPWTAGMKSLERKTRTKLAPMKLFGLRSRC